MTPTTIPPPNEVDRSIVLDEAYETYAFARKHDLTDLTDEGRDRVMGFIRRCHAAEQQVDAMRKRVEELSEALKPFAADKSFSTMTVGDVLRAADLLSTETTP